MKNKKLFYLSGLIISLTIFFSIIEPKRFLYNKTSIVVSTIILVYIVCLILFMIILKKFKPGIYEKIIKLIFDEEEEFNGEKYIEDLRNKIVHSSLIVTKDKKTEESADILELMLENMKEIRDYYVISKKQAKNAFSLAIFMCALGIMLIIIAVILSIAFELSLIISLIPAIGGAMAELIAGTSLVVYKTSLEQLNNYYESLHNNERFLSLVNLVSKISVKKQDEAYMSIINVELQNYRK